MKREILIQFAALLLFSAVGFSQQYNQEYIDSLIKSSSQAQVARTSKFALVGYTSVSAKFSKADGASFNNLVFNPILLWQPHKNIVIEAEMETEIEGTETKIDNFLRALIVHEIHHRGALCIYLNLLDIKTPPIFGLTEEQVIQKSK